MIKNIMNNFRLKITKKKLQISHVVNLFTVEEDVLWVPSNILNFFFWHLFLYAYQVYHLNYMLEQVENLHNPWSKICNASLIWYLGFSFKYNYLRNNLQALFVNTIFLYWHQFVSTTDRTKNTRNICMIRMTNFSKFEDENYN